MSHTSKNLELQEGVRNIWLNWSLLALVLNQHISEYNYKAFPIRQSARSRRRALKDDYTAAKV